MKGRLTLDKLNAGIEEMQKLLQAKYKILSMPPAKMLDKNLKKYKVHSSTLILYLFSLFPLLFLSFFFSSFFSSFLFSFFLFSLLFFSLFPLPSLLLPFPFPPLFLLSFLISFFFHSNTKMQKRMKRRASFF